MPAKPRITIVKGKGGVTCRCTGIPKKSAKSGGSRAGNRVIKSSAKPKGGIAPKKAAPKKAAPKKAAAKKAPANKAGGGAKCACK